MRSLWSLLERPGFYKVVQLFPGYFLTLAYRRLLHKHLPLSGSETILDVGCGTGNYALYFPEQKYIGIDINPDYISRAKRTYGHLAHATYLCVDLNRMPETRLSADHAYCVAITHHLTDEELMGMVDNVLKLVTSTFVIVDLCLPPLTRNPLGYLLVKLDRGRHARSRERLLSVLRRTKAEITNVTSDFGFPYPAVAATLAAAPATTPRGE